MTQQKNQKEALLTLYPDKRFMLNNFLSIIAGYISLAVTNLIIVLPGIIIITKADWLKKISIAIENINSLPYDKNFLSAAMSLLLTLLFVFTIFIIFCVVFSFLFIDIISIILLPFVLLNLLSYKFIRYEFHQDALVVYHGIIIKKKNIYPYRSIIYIQLIQSLFERILGLGTIVLMYPRPMNRMYWIEHLDIKTIQELYQKLSQLITLDHSRKIVYVDEKINCVFPKISPIEKTNQKNMDYQKELTKSIKALRSVIKAIGQLWGLSL